MTTWPPPQADQNVTGGMGRNAQPPAHGDYLKRTVAPDAYVYVYRRMGRWRVECIAGRRLWVRQYPTWFEAQPVFLTATEAPPRQSDRKDHHD